MIFYCVLTSAINTLASVVLALMVYWKKRHGPANAAFSWFALTGALWSAQYFLWQTAPDADGALFYSRMLTAAAILIPVAYYHFVLRLLGSSRPRPILFGYGMALVLAILSLTTDLLVVGVEQKGVFPHWPVPGALYPVYLLVFFAYTSTPLVLLVLGYRRAQGLVRNQLRFVILGTAIGFMGGATNFFLWYDVPIPPIGNGFVAFYVVGVGYAILRFRLMEFNLLTARLSAYTAIILVLAALLPTIMRGLAHLNVPTVPPIGFWPLFFTSVFVTVLLFGLIPSCAGASMRCWSSACSATSWRIARCCARSRRRSARRRMRRRCSARSRRTWPRRCTWRRSRSTRARNTKRISPAGLRWATTAGRPRYPRSRCSCRR